MARLTTSQSSKPSGRASIGARFLAYLTLAHVITCHEFHYKGRSYHACKQFVIAELARKEESNYGRA